MHKSDEQIRIENLIESFTRPLKEQVSTLKKDVEILKQLNISDLLFKREDIATKALQDILNMKRVNDSYADTCSKMMAIARNALKEIETLK